MAALSDYTEELLLDHLLTQGPFFLALYNSTPGDVDTGAEVVAASYARQAVTFTRLDSDLSNSNTLTFATATESWGTVSHVAIFDLVTGGNLMWHGPLLSDKIVSLGDVVTYPIGASVLNLN
jgi:hypothetical protein